MKRILLILCFFVPFVALTKSKSVEAIDIGKIPEGGLLLDKGWKFYPGDNINFSKRDFDDSAWQSIHPEKDIYSLPQVRKSEIGWFRLKLHVDSSFFNKTIAIIIHQSGASEIYFNGKLIYNLSKKPGNESVRLTDYPLALKFNQESTQELAVRYSISKKDFLINYLVPNYCLKLVLMPVNTVFSTNFSEARTYIFEQVILITLAFLLGAMSFFLYFNNRDQKSYYYFGVFSTSLILKSAVLLPSYFIFPPSLFLASTLLFMSHIFSLICMFSLLIGLYIIFKQKRGVFFLVLLIYGALTIPVFFLFYNASNVFGLLIFVIGNIEFSRIIVIGMRKKIPGAGIFLATINTFFLIFISFIYFIIKANIPLAQGLGVIAVIVVPIGMSIYLAYEFARTGVALKRRVVEVEQLSEKTLAQEQEKQNILASQNETLEKQVNERTAELNQSLTHLKETQTQLIQSEKMASLGELTAGIAHEIQNPLNFVNNFSEVSVELLVELKEEAEAGHTKDVIAIADDLTGNLEKISHHGKRADFIVKGMLQHSRISTGERQLTNINVLADEFLKLSYHGLRAKDKNFNAELVTNFDTNLPKVNVVQQDIGRVLINLFGNAFYAVNQKAKTAGPDYKPTVEVSTAQQNGSILVSVKDNGTGIPDTIKDKIMQPFFTTKPTGEGTGLGLSLSYDIVVKGHGGRIDVDTKAGEFTEFVVRLPL